MAFMVAGGGLGFTITTTTIGIIILVVLNMDFARMGEVDLPVETGTAVFMEALVDAEDSPTAIEVAVSREVGNTAEVVRGRDIVEVG